MQGDLFKFSAPASSAEPAVRTSFLEKSRVSLRMDQAVISLLCVMISFVVVFCVGVEKGKKIGIREGRYLRFSQQVAQPSVQAPAPLVVQTIPAAVTRNVQNAPAVEAIPVSVSAPVDAVKPEGRYTVQIVTYGNEKDAEKKLDLLSAKGFHGFVIPSGKYFQICVNGFATRQEAGVFLKDLKRQKIAPSDAYVRSIPL